jgi:hypothetical protein
LREGDSHAVNTIVRCVRLGQARGLSYGGFLTHRAILVFGRASLLSGLFFIWLRGDFHRLEGRFFVMRQEIHSF